MSRTSKAAPDVLFRRLCARPGAASSGDEPDRELDLLRRRPGVGSAYLGGLRVYYEVRDDPERVVVVKAVGIKDRDSVRIGGEEVEL
jgi:hypothetical protein